MAIKNIYIKELIVDNYKSLKGSKITLQNGLNIIIGKNGAGKSNVLEFISNYAVRAFSNLSRNMRSLNSNFSICIEYLDNHKLNTLTVSFKRLRKIDTLTVNPESNYLTEIIISKLVGSEKVISNKKYIVDNRESRKFLQKNEDFTEVLKVFRILPRTYIEFQFPQDAYWVSKPTRLLIDNSNEPNFEDSDISFSLFWNLEIEIEMEIFDTIPKSVLANNSLLKKFLSNYLKEYLEKKRINEILNKYSPIKKIRFNQNLNIYSNEQLTIVENLSIEFFIENDWMPWSYLSDGTKRLFYLLTEVATSENGLVLVEEPELGVHPHQLFEILNFLKEQSLDKQIIISTHSPIVLDILAEDELNRISIAKYESGTKFYKLTKSQIVKAKKYMKEVGELSYYWLHSDLEK